MFKPKTLEDFRKLQKVVDEINKENLYKLKLEVKQEFSECDLYVHDSTEELYYGEYLFEHTLEKLENALQIDTKDSTAYFDCVCPGLWIADFEGRTRYTEKDMETDIDLAIFNAICKYTDSNALEFRWTDKLKDKIDRFPVMIVSTILEALNETE